MREIKFRAWIEEENTMIYDFLIDAKNGEVDRFWYRPHIPSGWEENGDISTVNPRDFVVMQYTGLKDRNGKEIYEGDIVQWTEEYCCNRKGYKEVVDWNQDEAGFFPFTEVNNVEEKEWCSGISLKKIVVIGSIYENPDLIKN